MLVGLNDFPSLKLSIKWKIKKDNKKNTILIQTPEYFLHSIFLNKPGGNYRVPDWAQVFIKSALEALLGKFQLCLLLLPGITSFPKRFFH